MKINRKKEEKLLIIGAGEEFIMEDMSAVKENHLLIFKRWFFQLCIFEFINKMLIL